MKVSDSRYGAGYSIRARARHETLGPGSGISNAYGSRQIPRLPLDLVSSTGHHESNSGRLGGSARAESHRRGVSDHGVGRHEPGAKYTVASARASGRGDAARTIRMKLPLHSLAGGGEVAPRRAEHRLYGSYQIGGAADKRHHDRPHGALNALPQSRDRGALDSKDTSSTAQFSDARSRRSPSDYSPRARDRLGLSPRVPLGGVKAGTQGHYVHSTRVGLPMNTARYAPSTRQPLTGLRGPRSTGRKHGSRKAAAGQPGEKGSGTFASAGLGQFRASKADPGGELPRAANEHASTGAGAGAPDEHRSVERLRHGLAGMPPAAPHVPELPSKAALGGIGKGSAAYGQAAGGAGGAGSSTASATAAGGKQQPTGPKGGSGRGSTVEPSPKMTPAMVLRGMSSRLSEFEQSEILDYKSIYFVGRDKERKVKGSNRRGNNAGYDDDRANYRVVKGDHIGYRFEIMGELGSGSFGIVMQALDHKTGRTVALKIIRNKKRFHRQAKIEVDLLKRLRDADANDDAGIIHLHEWFVFRNHLCITFPMLGGDLYGYLKKRRFRGLPIASIRRIAGYVFRCLDFLHGRRIVHCDIKPENLLLCVPSQEGGDKYRPCGPTRDSTVSGTAHRGMSQAQAVGRGLDHLAPGEGFDVRMIDFGSSCFEDKRAYTYIYSRFYRSPEVIMHLKYGRPVDVWSTGAMLSELYTGEPIFQGEDEKDQLACIMELCGPPPVSMIEESPRKKTFFYEDGAPIVRLSSKGRARVPSSRTINKAMRNPPDPAFIDFVHRCLAIDPKKRLTPAEALRHPFLTADWAATRVRSIDVVLGYDKQAPLGPAAGPRQGTKAALEGEGAPVAGKHTSSSHPSAGAAAHASSKGTSTARKKQQAGGTSSIPFQSPAASIRSQARQEQGAAQAGSTAQPMQSPAMAAAYMGRQRHQMAEAGTRAQGGAGVGYTHGHLAPLGSGAAGQHGQGHVHNGSRASDASTVKHDSLRVKQGAPVPPDSFSVTPSRPFGRRRPAGGHAQSSLMAVPDKAPLDSEDHHGAHTARHAAGRSEPNVTSSTIAAQRKRHGERLGEPAVPSSQSVAAPRDGRGRDGRSVITMPNGLRRDSSVSGVTRDSVATPANDDSLKRALMRRVPTKDTMVSDMSDDLAGMEPTGSDHQTVGGSTNDRGTGADSRADRALTSATGLTQLQALDEGAGASRNKGAIGGFPGRSGRHGSQMGRGQRHAQGLSQDQGQGQGQGMGRLGVGTRRRAGSGDAAAATSTSTAASPDTGATIKSPKPPTKQQPAGSSQRYGKQNPRHRRMRTGSSSPSKASQSRSTIESGGASVASSMQVGAGAAASARAGVSATGPSELSSLSKRRDTSPAITATTRGALVGYLGTMHVGYASQSGRAITVGVTRDDH